MFGAQIFVLAIAAFAWGASLSAYRWVALQNAWPMGAWQAEQPLLARFIGLGAIVVALLTSLTLGGAVVPLVAILGGIGAVIWTAVLKVGAQSALLLAPVAAVAAVICALLG